MGAVTKIGSWRQEEKTRHYIAEMLDQMADMAETVADHDMGNIAFQLRILASRTLREPMNIQ